MESVKHPGSQIAEDQIAVQSLMNERTTRAESLSQMFSAPNDHPYTAIEHFFNLFNDFWSASTKQMIRLIN